MGDSCPGCVERDAMIAELRRQLDSMGYKEKVDRKVYMREYMRKRRGLINHSD